jgi:hypothetical protein
MLLSATADGPPPPARERDGFLDHATEILTERLEDVRQPVRIMGAGVRYGAGPSSLRRM